MIIESLKILDSGSTPFVLANTRDIFNPDQVERKLRKAQGMAQGAEGESLRNMYQAMLERGPGRVQVKLSGIGEVSHLYDNHPNFREVTDEIKRSVALSASNSSNVEITPILLLGEPGIGKTYFAKKLADLLSTGMNLVPMSSMTAGWLLSGSSSQWKGAKPGKVFEALIDGDYANPVILVDEIDKASGDVQYDPLGALYSLLEHDTAKSFTDEFADVAVDASQVIWIATANDEKAIPEPILNRMNVFSVPKPNFLEARQIARNLYQTIRDDHSWGTNFMKEPSHDLLDCLVKIVPREMRRAIMTGFGNAALAKKDNITPEDLPPAKKEKGSIGFLN